MFTASIKLPMFAVNCATMMQKMPQPKVDKRDAR